MTIADIPVALLAGGLATRLQPVTSTIPKALVEVAGRPFIDHQLELLYENGIRRVVLCIGHLGEQIQSHLGDGRSHGMEISYAFDGPFLLGTGGAIRRALPLLGELFWVMYGDSYMDIAYPTILDYFQSVSATGLMTVIKNDNQWDRSNAEFRDGRLLNYNKRQITPAMSYIDYGVALLRRSAIDPLPVDRPSDLADVYSRLVANGEMIGYEVHQRFYEIGTPAGLEDTRRYLQHRLTTRK